MRARRWIAVLVLAVVTVGVSAASALAEPPPGVPPPGVPPTVIPVPVPITGAFSVHPTSGPVGSKVKIQGACGFSSTQLLYGVHIKTANGFQIIWIPEEFPALRPTPLGVFTTGFYFPAFGNIPPAFGGLGPVPVTPGTYWVGRAASGLRTSCRSDPSR